MRTPIGRSESAKLQSENPAGFHTDWMYGGNTILFYGDYARGHGCRGSFI